LCHAQAKYTGGSAARVGNAELEHAFQELAKFEAAIGSEDSANRGTGFNRRVRP
jgi:hypothetical protein